MRLAVRCGVSFLHPRKTFEASKFVLAIMMNISFPHDPMLLDINLDPLSKSPV